MRGLTQHETALLRYVQSDRDECDFLQGADEALSYELEERGLISASWATDRHGEDYERLDITPLGLLALRLNSIGI